jgi:hypothetical protein
LVSYFAKGERPIYSRKIMDENLFNSVLWKF